MYFYSQAILDRHLIAYEDQPSRNSSDLRPALALNHWLIPVELSLVTK